MMPPLATFPATRTNSRQNSLRNAPIASADSRHCPCRPLTGKRSRCSQAGRCCIFLQRAQNLSRRWAIQTPVRRAGTACGDRLRAPDLVSRPRCPQPGTAGFADRLHSRHDARSGPTAPWQYLRAHSEREVYFLSRRPDDSVLGDAICDGRRNERDPCGRTRRRGRHVWPALLGHGFVIEASRLLEMP
jgi:hypothetical protein